MDKSQSDSLNRSPYADASRYTDATRVRVMVADDARNLANLARKLVAISESELRSDGTVSAAGGWIKTAARLVDAAEQLLVHAVVFERVGGISWQRIGDELGISRQSAYERYTKAEHHLREQLARMDELIHESGKDPDEKARLIQREFHPALSRPDATALGLDSWLAQYRDPREMEVATSAPVSGGLRSKLDGDVELEIRRIREGELPDPETVHLERASDFDVKGSWRVLSAKDGAETLVGFLRPVLDARGTRRWTAVTASDAQVPYGPWKTRKEALGHLLAYYKPVPPSSAE